MPFLFDNMVETGLLAIDGPAKLDADPKADLDTKNKAGVIEVRLKLAGLSWFLSSIVLFPLEADIMSKLSPSEAVM